MKWDAENFWKFLLVVLIGVLFLQQCWNTREVKEALTKQQTIDTTK